MLHAHGIYLTDVVVLGKIPHIGRTVDDEMERQGRQWRQTRRNDEVTADDAYLVGVKRLVAEIIGPPPLQPSPRLLLVAATHQTDDAPLVGGYKPGEQVDAQEPCRPREQESPAFGEGLLDWECFLRKETVDFTVVVVVGCFFKACARPSYAVAQESGRGMREDVGIGEWISVIPRCRHHLHGAERRPSQGEEIIRGPYFLHAQHLRHQ